MHTFRDNHDKTWILQLKINRLVRETLVAELGVDLMHPIQCIEQIANMQDIPSITERAIWLICKEQAAEIGITDPEAFWERFDEELEDYDPATSLLSKAYQALEDELLFFIRRLYVKRPKAAELICEQIQTLGAKRDLIIEESIKAATESGLTEKMIKRIGEEMRTTYSKMAIGESPGVSSELPVS